MRRPALPQLVLYALALVVAVALVVAASTTTAAFGAYNVEWDGTSDFREVADRESDARVVLETSAYETADPDDAVAVALAPTEAYGENDSRYVREFVAAGGTLVVADDVGPHGDRLLGDVGATMRFDGARLRDERSYYRAPSLPVATNVAESPYTVGVGQLTLNGATAVEFANSTAVGNETPATNATAIVTTSPFGYLDRNATGALSPDDELGRYPVVAVESVGDGRVIAVGDPSVFINAMLTEPDNEAFATALLEAGDRTLLDYSHAGDQPPLAVALLEFRSSPAAQVAFGLFGVAAIWRYGRHGAGDTRTVKRRLRAALPRRWRTRLPVWLLGSGSEDDGPAVDEATVLAALRRRYPEWDETRLRRAMTDVLSERDRGGEDE
ncbi:DUF4350 domain-containing protein [Halorubrum halodurans]|uniref:DUF4350 domain-containing protein n=1 Tax=Halorubrum halodurans TaxID=1383851 RepID=A0A256IJA0_9EURY|nr:DUF4350 domain-containing protein [Halorubrum halodurans]OYR56619.1 hypothetical protein DJ70_08280 [Halorubrum halodurans]